MPSLKDNSLSAMVIEDDPLMREIISQQLANMKFQVTVAFNGKHAERLIDEGADPELLVVDLIMPEKEGLETIIDLRKNRPLIKIVAITAGGAFKAESLLNYAQKFGADAAFQKPIDFEEFEKTVNSLF